MPSEVSALIEQFRTQLDLRDAAQAARMAAAWASSMRGLMDECERLAQEMADRAARGLPVARWHVQRAERYQSLMRQVAAKQAELRPQLAASIADEQADMLRLALEHSQAALDFVAPGIVGQFDRLNYAAVESMVGNTGAGGPLDRLLRQSWAGSEAAIGDALMRGIALGWSPLKTAAAMRDAANIPLQRSLVIARTETLRAYREATQRQYRTAGIEGYRRLADKSPRTCVACLMMDGQWFPMSTPFAEHPMGRCAMVPARDKNAPIPWQTGAEWFAQQDAATQRQMLGPGRYDAWQGGSFALGDLPVLVRNPTWGDSWHVRSLTELTGRAAAAEAPEPVVRAIRDFDDENAAHAWGLQHYASWRASLTEDEERYIVDYQHTDYRFLNEELRSGGTLDSYSQPRVNGIDRAIARTQVPEDVRVWRGMENQAIVDNWDHIVGTTIQDRGYVSTTLSREQTNSFLDVERPILADIVLPKGTKAAYLESVWERKEYEMLLPHGQSFRVVNAYAETITWYGEPREVLRLSLEAIP